MGGQRGTPRTRRRSQIIALLTAATAGLLATVPQPASRPGSAAELPATSRLLTLDPVRLADTRRDDCGCTAIDAQTIRVAVADALDDGGGPTGEVVAAVVTVTGLPSSGPGFVTAYPAGAKRPLVSTLNTRTDRVVANSAIVPVGDQGAIDLYRHTPGDLVVDLSAVFVRADRATGGRFVALPPARLADTRTDTAPGSPLAPGGELVVPLPAAVPDDAVALVVNLTSVAATAPGHLTLRASGDDATDTSVLNVDGTGAAVAASTIVPVDAGGLIVSSHSGGHVVVDAVGWFTGDSAGESADGLFVPLLPQRLIDTRTRPDRLAVGGTIEVAAPAPGAAIAANVTAVDADAAGFVTAFAAGTPPPPTSSVNPAFWNHTVANFAIVGASDRGLAFSSMRGTDLVVDATGWFTGTPTTATEPPLPNVHRPPRTLIVGDSTLVAMQLFPESFASFRGIDVVYDAMSCRRLRRPSCTSGVTGVTPNTAVEAIETTPGAIDVVVIKTGYNDWFGDFEADVTAVVDAARNTGAHTVLWLTYNEPRHVPRGALAMQQNTAQLREIAARPGYPDVLVADWLSYSRDRPDWFWDGIHMTREGSFALGDYVSRWVAAIEHRACPSPWVPGGPIIDPCVPPEWVGPVPSPELL